MWQGFREIQKGRTGFSFDPATGRFQDTGFKGQGYFATPEQRGSVERTMPTVMNPALGRWRNAAVANLAPGSAQAAAMGQRVQSRGLAALGRQAPGYWSRLMDLYTEYMSTAKKIPTTSSDAAALGGFVQGGGLQGLGMLYGGL